MTTLSYILVLFALYLIIEILLRRKFKTKIRKMLIGNGFKKRHRVFLTIEILLIISYGTVSLLLIQLVSPTLLPYVMFVFFSLLYVLRGTEEWLFKRKKKEYYHSWLAAGFFSISSIILFVM